MELRDIDAACRMDEAAAVAALRQRLTLDDGARSRTEARARALAERVRAAPAGFGAETFLQQYGLSTREGTLLMCLAEALLRIPDADTAESLIRDKLAGTAWGASLSGEDFLMNAASWGLLLTGRLAEWREAAGDTPQALLHRTLARLGEPLARTALAQAMRILAGQFVRGETIEAALASAAEDEAKGYRFSYDMLGEAALGSDDAEHYVQAYAGAIAAVGAASRGRGPIAGPGVSVKLSALHPRFEPAQAQRVLAEMLPRLVALARQAREAQVGLTIDAEECDRLMLTLELFGRLLREPSLDGWEGLGIAVQAYQKRAAATVDWLVGRAREAQRRIVVRLVKGAYWDSEIKLAQTRGLDYPVFTRRAATDVSYLACARALFDADDAVFPAFATHNCRTLASVVEMAGKGRNGQGRDFEFQKLQGMGDALYRQATGADGLPCRIYAPVGGHRDLLPYLVRRLLENGANSSFVHQIADPAVPLEKLLADPVAATAPPYAPNPRTPPPREMLPWRSAAGLDLADATVLQRLTLAVAASRAGPTESATGTKIVEPADARRVVGHAENATPETVRAAVAGARAAQPAWNALTAEARASCLERAADLMEARREVLMTLCVREAGKTLPDALAEVREAVDYCRYYAREARRLFGAPLALAGPTGEVNSLALHGRGVFACISPWNFPLAIFTGQVAAALAAGNAVVSKPAEQTPLIARATVALLHEAGVPAEALRLVCGAGETVGGALVACSDIAGVAFTGSLEAARSINRALAARAGPIATLIAETGGQNAMVVDSSALPEQVVRDVLSSAFQSAGQRCSALRILALQEDIAERVEALLAGAMAELVLGDPGDPATDVGPIIDAAAAESLRAYIAALRPRARLIAERAVPPGLTFGHYVAPVAFGIALEQIPRKEVFGPVLHIVRYRAGELDALLDTLNATGYGLTLGIQSRVDAFTRRVAAHLRAGNVYVNRNMIGAVVGVQPFGGEGLSGTGPKAGGPHTLLRYAAERTLSINTAAVGGNAQLLGED